MPNMVGASDKNTGTEDFIREADCGLDRGGEMGPLPEARRLGRREVYSGR